jgi:hypothetical protein
MTAQSPGLRLPAEAPVSGEVVGFGIDAERDAGGGTERCPATLTVIAYQGWRGPGCPCAPYRRRGHDPTPPVTEAGGTAPERMGEAPEMADSRRAIPEQGSKRATLEQGMSDRPVNKA